MNTNPLDTILRIGRAPGADSRPARPGTASDDFVRILQQAATPKETTIARREGAPPARTEFSEDKPFAEVESLETDETTAASQEDQGTNTPQQDAAEATPPPNDSSERAEEKPPEVHETDEVEISEAAAAAQLPGDAPVQEVAPDQAVTAAVEHTSGESHDQASRNQQAAPDAAALENAQPTSQDFSPATTQESEQADEKSSQPTASSQTQPDVEEVLPTPTAKKANPPRKAAGSRTNNPAANTATAAKAASPAESAEQSQQHAADRSTPATDSQPADSADAEAESKPNEPTAAATSTRHEFPRKEAAPAIESEQPQPLKASAEVLAEAEEPTPLPATARTLDSTSTSTPHVPTAGGEGSTAAASALAGGGSSSGVETASQATLTDEPVPTENRARFVQRVANAFRHAQQNDGQIQLRLSPPELGSLKIEISVRNGVLSANLEMETSEARRVVLDNLPALRQRLAEQDIRIDKFEVDVRREGGQPGDQGNWEENRSRQAQRSNGTQRSSSPTATTAPGNRVATNNPLNIAEGLDVRI